ncbi:hypothetical protein EDB87DRAFT_429381 [Lactarius vividus]|nr:hypothetical protein EDB87DRAFT_429381 [Lactarius vividus]
MNMTSHFPHMIHIASAHPTQSGLGVRRLTAKPSTRSPNVGEFAWIRTDRTVNYACSRGSLTCILYKLFPVRRPSAIVLPLLAVNVSIPLPLLKVLPALSHRPSEIKLFLLVGMWRTCSSRKRYLWPSHLDSSSTVPRPATRTLVLPMPTTVTSVSHSYVTNDVRVFATCDTAAVAAIQSSVSDFVSAFPAFSSSFPFPLSQHLLVTCVYLPANFTLASSEKNTILSLMVVFACNVCRDSRDEHCRLCLHLRSCTETID